jgi:D-alanyl-D-alanine carboxypeptidase
MLISQQAHEQRALASITKLMTALVALDTGYALERPVPLNRRWSTVLPARSYTRGELMTAMLVRSDNSASETLAEDYPGGREEFIREMNERARKLGMLSTHFEDASGLSKFSLGIFTYFCNSFYYRLCRILRGLRSLRP